MPTSSRKKLVLTLALTGLAIAALTATLTLYILASPPSASAHAERYNAIARAHKAATQDAPTSPPAQIHSPTDLTAAYRAVWQESEGLEEDFKATLDPGSRLAEWTRTEDETLLAKPIPQPCLALGVPPNTNDTMARSMSAAHCELIANWSPAVDRLLAASRRDEPGAPFSIWDDWSTNDKGEPKSPLRLLYLIRLGLDRAYLGWLGSGELGPYLELALATPHIGHDVATGADMVSAMLGSAIANVGPSRLLILYSSNGPTTDAARSRQIVEGSLAALRAPDLYPQIAAAEYLNFYGQLLPNDALLDKPPIARSERLRNEIEASPTLERLATWWALGDTITDAGALVAELPDDFAGRQALYPPPEQDQASSLHFPFQRYDGNYTALRGFVCMVALVYAERLAQHQGQKVMSLDALDPKVVQACAQDPVTAEPTTLVIEGDKRRVVSHWAKDPAGSKGRYNEYDITWLDIELKDVDKGPAPVEP